eukprot:Plantae.Rhodophyta-Rhodochaete_pulchella.ctg9486.p1 GENE.Plantae.Rhodophyta-Rhodochaete_pulchella.ctg9486~~Plantae.Rhodophyta-Rhodochaete_pulchella.ctg9486.p1  ORF type:complete len:222 (-),score=30.09 Plantae.Rhodophyta-Rhodochaete_pulchella.ctg9486:312-977(-)
MAMVGALARMGSLRVMQPIRGSLLCRMAATAVASEAGPAAMNDRMNAAKRGESWLLSLTGPNRIGIVRDMVSGVAQHGGNVEESRMATLGGEFAVISRVTIEAARADDMIAAVRTSFPEHDLHAKPTSVRETPPVDHRTVKLSLEGPDSVGIVAMLTESLSRNSINIHDMRTEVVAAPFAGYPIFQLEADLTLPEGSISTLSESIRTVEEKYGMTATLSEV